MTYQIRNERSQELRTVEWIGTTGPGPLVIFRVPPVHVSSSPSGTFATPVHVFSLNSGRSPGAMKEWAIDEGSWKRLVAWWRENQPTKVSPRYNSTRKASARKAKKADPRQLELL